MGKIVALASPLPATVEEFLAFGDTIVSLVRAEHLKLMKDESYRRLLAAVYNSEAVHGSLTADDFAAAWRIQQSASQSDTKLKDTERYPWDAVRKALNEVLKQHGQSRRQRRQAVEFAQLQEKYDE